MAIVVLLTVLGGCESDPLGPLPLTLRTNEAEARWRRANLQSYSFYSTASCFCPEEYASRKIVRVVDGVVVSVRDQATGTVRPVTFREPIDSLFALLRREARSGRVQEAEFDGQRGFPVRLRFGSDLPDDGVLILVEEVKPTVTLLPAQTAGHDR